MALNTGNEQASEGLAHAIYVELDRILRPPLEQSMEGMKPEPRAKTVQASQTAWKKLSFAIASGVVSHLRREEPSEVEYAEVVSSATEDPAYWTWLSGFVQRFEDWASGPTPNPAVLKTSLTTFFAANPAAPQGLKGVIQ